MNADTIQGYFEQADWPAQKQPPAATCQDWATGYKGEQGNFAMTVRLTPSWFYVLAPVPEVRVHPSQYGALLAKNYEMSMTKWSLDSDGELILSAEVPCDLTFSEFRDCLQAVAYYLDSYWQELQTLAAPKGGE